jgi:hypothetical protein
MAVEDGPAVVLGAVEPDDQGLRDVSQELIKDEIGRVDGVMVRTDTKAGLLLAVFSPLTVVGAAVLTTARLPPVAEGLFAAAAAMFGSAVLVLLWTVRPRIMSGSGFPVYARMTHADIAQYFTRRYQAIMATESSPTDR